MWGSLSCFFFFIYIVIVVVVFFLPPPPFCGGEHSFIRSFVGGLRFLELEYFFVQESRVHLHIQDELYKKKKAHQRRVWYGMEVLTSWSNPSELR